MLDRFFLIVEGAHWLKRLLPRGVKLVQLRGKDKTQDEIPREIAGANRPLAPLVAIGGINLERAAGVLAAGADSAAVVTDVLRNPDPEARARAFVEVTRCAPSS